MHGPSKDVKQIPQYKITVVLHMNFVVKSVSVVTIYNVNELGHFYVLFTFSVAKDVKDFSSAQYVKI